jgi:DNA-binding beta-propeller fold protein YncE
MRDWTRKLYWLTGAAALVSAGAVLSPSEVAAGGDRHGDRGDRGVPRFKVDASWPKTLPNNWVIGQTGGIAVDSRDHIWLLQRPRSIAERYLGPSLTPPRSTCCVAAPSVLEFDPKGRLVQAWGGPSDPGFIESRCTPAMGCEWPDTEHGIFVDDKGFVYVGGNGTNDHQVVKFKRDGTFVMQIGKSGSRGASHPVSFAPNGTPLLGRPAEMDLDSSTNELYIADGYQNRRIIVVDATTGKYKRHWGAYGNVPNDDPLPPYDPAAPLPQQFRTPVHCVAVANDGLVYVCDRLNNRIQVFRKNGTYVKEFFADRDTRGNGSVYNAGLSPDRAQKYLFNADGENQHIWTFDRKTGEALALTSRGGRQAGELAAAHSLAVDSKGNIYIGEVDTSMRVQKFERVDDDHGHGHHHRR